MGGIIPNSFTIALHGRCPQPNWEIAAPACMVSPAIAREQATAGQLVRNGHLPALRKSRSEGLCQIGQDAPGPDSRGDRKGCGVASWLGQHAHWPRALALREVIKKRAEILRRGVGRGRYGGRGVGPAEGPEARWDGFGHGADLRAHRLLDFILGDIQSAELDVVGGRNALDRLSVCGRDAGVEGAGVELTTPRVLTGGPGRQTIPVSLRRRSRGVTGPDGGDGQQGFPPCRGSSAIVMPAVV